MSDEDYDYESGSIGDDDYNYEDMQLEERKSSIKEDAAQKNVLTGAQFLYKCIHTSFFELQTINKIKKVSNQLGIPSGQALFILRKYKYLEKPCLLNGINDYSDQLFNQEIYKDIQECLLCCDETQLYSQSCGHNFCKQCYSTYIQTILKEGAACIFKKCPMEGCKMNLDIETFQQFLDIQSFKRYRYFLVQDCLQNSEYVVHCTQNQCENLLELNDNNISFKKQLINVKCECGNNFCSLCKKDAHRPATCENLEQWEGFLGGKNTDNLNNAWMKLNSKKCPECKVDIEKNQGCMHMTCKQCKHEFCWLCLGNWKKHSTCNKFNANEDQVSKDKKLLEKYTFYSDRYIQHKKGLQLTMQQRQDTIQQFDNFSTLIQPPEHNDYIIKAVDLVLDCRRAIAYSYIIGYYIKDENKRQFFEFQQGNIEDKLEILDNKISNTDFSIFIEQNQYSYYLKNEYHLFKADLKKLSQDLASYFNKMLQDFETGFNENPTVPSQITIQKQQVKTSVYHANKGGINNIKPNQKPIKAQTVSSQVYKNNGAIRASQDQWICRFCTIRNSIENVICEMCFQDRQQ